MWNVNVCCVIAILCAFFVIDVLSQNASNTNTTILAGVPPKLVGTISKKNPNIYKLPAGLLCEGLNCPGDTTCTLSQPKCTAKDCSLKPSCTKSLSADCEKCAYPCVHSVVNRNASEGCHPCLCDVTVIRSPTVHHQVIMVLH